MLCCVLMHSLIFRTDASSHVGTGHLLRCLALASACKNQCIHSVFALTSRTSLEERIIQEKMSITHIQAKRGSMEDAENLIAIAKEKNAKWIILDGYNFDHDYQKQLREAGFKLLVIDDYSHLPEYNCDILMNQNIDAKDSDYSHKTDAKLLLGPKYALLRDEFVNFVSSERVIPDVAGKVLVTLGGSDDVNATPIAINAINKIRDHKFSVQVIVGGENLRMEEIKESASQSPHDFSFHQNVSDMPQRMAWADIAIGAGGSTSWEFLYMGLPFITGILAENQEGIANELGRQNFAVNIGWYKDCSVDEFSDAIKKLVEDKALRTHLSESGRKVVDGRGVSRVLEAISVYARFVWDKTVCRGNGDKQA